jgi:hypothetical protein
MTRSRNDTTSRRPVDRHLDFESVLYMIHHVFLPPKLPQEDDIAPRLDGTLIDIVLESLQEFSNPQGHDRTIDSVISMVGNIRAVHDGFGHITQTRLEETLAKLSKDGRTALLYITDLSRLKHRSITRPCPECGHHCPQRPQWGLL